MEEKSFLQNYRTVYITEETVMENKNLHITVEEAIALVNREFELLPETVKHLENCKECSNVIAKYLEIHFSLRTNEIEPDEAVLSRVAESSFAILQKELSGELSQSGISIKNWFSGLFRPLILTAGAAAIAFAVYTGVNSLPEESEDNRKAQNENENEKNDTKDNREIMTGLKKAGSRIELAEATIEAIDDTVFVKVTDESVKMKKGKAKFDVVSGNDFRVDINESFLVRVLGTSFILNYNGKDLSVSVSDGLVEVVENKTGEITQLSAGMAQIFNNEKRVMKKSGVASIKRAVLKKQPVNPKLRITPDAPFLTQGREALASGNEGAALQLFLMEIKNGSEKDKALFESAKLHESRKQNREIVSILKKHKDILDSSSVYREELLIKGCMAQKRSGLKGLTFCHEYIKVFPEGYRNSEIRALLNE